MRVVVTIDGPAGSGKSTLADELAERLDVPHVDTGAYYRAATLVVLRAGVDPVDEAACEAVVAPAHIGRRARRTLLDGEDVEVEIRGEAVTRLVSTVSAHPAVRATLLDAQRRGIGPRGAVVEGRDAGTVVAPDADLKVWLTADASERARRRAAQLGDEGEQAVAAHVTAITERDARDAARMVPAPGVVVLDTAGRTVEDLVDELERLATESAAHGAIRTPASRTPRATPPSQEQH